MSSRRPVLVARKHEQEPREQEAEPAAELAVDQLDHPAAGLQDGVGGGAGGSGQVERGAGRAARRHQQGVPAVAHQSAAYRSARPHMEPGQSKVCRTTD